MQIALRVSRQQLFGVKNSTQNERTNLNNESYGECCTNRDHAYIRIHRNNVLYNRKGDRRRYRYTLYYLREIDRVIEERERGIRVMTNKSQILFIIAALLAVMSEAFVSRPMLMNRADTKLHLKTTGMYLLYIYLYCHRYFWLS